MLFVLDVGGVLRDSSLAIYESLKHAFEKKEVPFPFTPQEIWHLRGLPSFHSGRQAINILLSLVENRANLTNILERPDAEFYLNTFFKTYHDEDLVEEIYSEFKKSFNSDEMKSRIKVFDFAEECVSRLKTRHSVALFSNASLKTLKRDIPFLDLFDLVLTGDNVPKKPSGEGIRKIMAELNFPPEKTVYVGDSCVDILAARDAGVRSAVVLSGMGLEHHLRLLSPDYIFQDLVQLTNHFLELDIHHTVAILVKQGNRYLLVKRGKEPWKGFWAIPGGHVEDEGIFEAAMRDEEEEIGRTEILKKLFVFTHDVEVGHRHVCYVFLARLLEDPRPGGDAEEIGWFSLEEIKKLPLAPSTISIFNFLRYGDSLDFSWMR
jgi:8-oxo-dGTP diphosphatase